MQVCCGMWLKCKVLVFYGKHMKGVYLAKEF